MELQAMIIKKYNNLRSQGLTHQQALDRARKEAYETYGVIK